MKTKIRQIKNKIRQKPLSSPAFLSEILLNFVSPSLSIWLYITQVLTRIATHALVVSGHTRQDVGLPQCWLWAERVERIRRVLIGRCQRGQSRGQIWGHAPKAKIQTKATCKSKEYQRLDFCSSWVHSWNPGRRDIIIFLFKYIPCRNQHLNLSK